MDKINKRYICVEKNEMIVRSGYAIWRGDIQSGFGELTSQSNVLKNQPYSFQTRYKSPDGRDGTNPEELMATAHAGCFAMAVSLILINAGYIAEEIRTSAAIAFTMAEGGFSVTAIELELHARVARITKDEFHKIAIYAKENCPISKLLASVPISLKIVLN
jgi:osmotically inducible protein OsmC